ncbi:MAG: type 1 glutamine amidotransferase [Bacteroidales bacterium]|nr:type 1 glutamine amidotransferase [Bacteroidales bacterium]
MIPLKIHCFQHVDFEDPGCIETWIKKTGTFLTYTRFFQNYTIPEPEDYDCLIIMGGPMSVYNDDKYSWLTEEKNAIKKSIEKEKTVIGICLGAQLIADALGAEVYKNPEKELGWFDITLEDDARNNDLFGNDLKTIKTFHWHSETFNLPSGAKRLASSRACENQAFLYKKNVLGLQFHLEVTEICLKAMLENGRNEITEGNYTQSETEILSQQNLIRLNNDIMYNILDKLMHKYICVLFNDQD